ncbi:maleylpyruvate isomerase family mycothiol-dependent enzyme [Nonomuraea dietziae]|uniref:maleylpyruvate isomerase family mycothiol-dependent enzyme n=1 Tax=Nonomuraea dietziae TaxID=65515 RepID=UPI0033C93E41
MDRDKTFSWLKAERLSLADFLDDLGAHEWETDSLCPGWTVHDVAAHLTMSTRSTLLGTIGGVIRARGDFLATGRVSGLAALSGSGAQRIAARLGGR